MQAQQLEQPERSALATPTRQQIAARGRSEPGKVTGKIKAAIGFMVWECLKRDDAATKAGLTAHGLREALRRPHVRAHYLREIEVLRTSERAKNIHRLTEIRDAADNMPAVNAIKLLEQIDSDAPSGGTVRQAGITIVIQGASEPRIMQTIEHEARDANNTITKDAD